MATDDDIDRAQVADRRRWLALVVLCVGQLMIVLDATVVNVALPTIQRDLHFSQSSLAWVINAYLITFGGLLLLAGRLGDLIGPKRIFVTGLTVFTAASAFCGFSQSQAELIVARFVQGAGAAIVAATILGILVTLFPEPREKAKAMGVYAFVASAGGSIGLLAGGVSDPGSELALDLLHQPAHRMRRARLRPGAHPGARGDGDARRGRRARRRAWSPPP